MRAAEFFPLLHHAALKQQCQQEQSGKYAETFKYKSQIFTYL